MRPCHSVNLSVIKWIWTYSSLFFLFRLKCSAFSVDLTEHILPSVKTWSAKIDWKYRELEKNKTTSTAYAQNQSITEKRLKKRRALNLPFFALVEFSELNHFLFFSVCIFKLFLVSSVTVYAGLRNIGTSKQKNFIIKLREGLKVQTEKEKIKNDSPLKTKPLQKGPKKKNQPNRVEEVLVPRAAPVPPRVSFPRPRSVACSWKEKKTEQHRTAETQPCANLHGYPLPNNPKKQKHSNS